MTETTIEPFLRNAWYLGAWSDEVAVGGVLARTIMSQPLVFFRSPDGKAAALEGRCCQWGAPLTRGNVVETGIDCGYHGLIFDGSGKCVSIPGADKIPPQSKVRSYPVVERQDVVIIFVTVTGMRGGLLSQESFMRKVYGDEAEAGQSAIQKTTAAGVMVLVDFLRSGKLPADGFLRPEQISLDDFMGNRFAAPYG